MARTPEGVSPFLAKLWLMVNDPQTDNYIGWSPDGNSFIVPDRDTFAKNLLPHYYKHNKWNSFVRVLNMYGFRKEVNVNAGSLLNARDDEQYKHPCFRRGHEYLLVNIKRTHSSQSASHRSTPTPAPSTSENGIPPAHSLQPLHPPNKPPELQEEQVNRVLNDVRTLRCKQDTTDQKLDSLKRENERLWAEMQELRAKHQHQQTVVNKLIEFFVALLQNSGSVASTLLAPAPQLAIQSLVTETPGGAGKRKRSATRTGGGGGGGGEGAASTPVANAAPASNGAYEGPIIRDVTDAWTAAYSQQNPEVGELDWDRLLTNVENGQMLNGLRNAANSPATVPDHRYTPTPPRPPSTAGPSGPATLGNLTSALSALTSAASEHTSRLPQPADNTALVHLLLNSLLRTLPTSTPSPSLAGSPPVQQQQPVASSPQPVLVTTVPVQQQQPQMMVVQQRAPAGPLALQPNTTLVPVQLGTLLQFVKPPVQQAGPAGQQQQPQRLAYSIQYPDSPVPPAPAASPAPPAPAVSPAPSVPAVSMMSPRPAVSMMSPGGGQLLPGYVPTTSSQMAPIPIQSTEMAQQVDTVQHSLDSLRDTLTSPGFNLDFDQLMQIFAYPDSTAGRGLDAMQSIAGDDMIGIDGHHDESLLLGPSADDLLSDLPSDLIEGVTIQIPAYPGTETAPDEGLGGISLPSHDAVYPPSNPRAAATGAGKRKRRM